MYSDTDLTNSLHLEKEYDTNYVVTGNIDKFGYLRAVGGLPLKIAVISQSDNKPNLIIAPNQQIGTIKLFDKKPALPTTITL